MKTNPVTMKTPVTISLICLFSLIALNAPLAADKGSKKSKKANDTPNASVRPDGKIDFSITVSERKIIQDYCNGAETNGKKGRKAKSLPPGLAKKVARGGRLPPGWEKKVVVREIMPPEVFKECHPLPQEIVVKLPAPPVGAITVAVEGKVVRLMEATREILDVFDVLPRPPMPRP
jgi:hypothetical protein